MRKVEAAEIGIEPGAGKELARYRLEELIGRGGMGVVYRAHDLDLDRTVALKLIDPGVISDPEEFRARFRREATLGPALDHPHIMPVYEAGETEGFLYLVMPYIEDGDLKKALSTEGTLSKERTAAVIGQIALALDAAHEAGLVHRDVKPQNILLYSDRGRGAEHTLLSDFGLVMQVTPESQVTMSGQLLGSLHYVAPEQIQNKPVDGRADVYSLGCVLHECLTGQVPYDRDSGFAVLWAHVNETPEPASRTSRRVPPAIDSVIATALATDPNDRYLTAGDLASATQEALGVRSRRLAAAPVPFLSSPTRTIWKDAPKSTTPIFRNEDRKRRPRGGWLAAAVAVALALALMPLSRSGPSPTQAGIIDSAPSEAAPVAGEDGALAQPEGAGGRDRKAGRRSAAGPAPAHSGRVAPPDLAQDPGIPGGSVPVSAPIAKSGTAIGNGLLIYDRWTTPDYLLSELWLVDPSGAGNRRFGGTGSNMYEPEWSPNGRRIAFMFDGDVYVVDADGSSQVRVTRDGGNNHMPSWSPDGKRLVIESRQARTLRIVNVDGTGLRELPTGGAWAYDPAWSPDGDLIAFRKNSNPDGDLNNDIWVIRPDGSGLRRITTQLGWDGYPAWSPSGKEIMFDRCPAPAQSCASDLYVMKRDGSGVRRITNTTNIGESSPTWSPDGNFIAYTALEETEGEIWIAHSDGSNPRQITDTPTFDEWHISWQRL